MSKEYTLQKKDTIKCSSKEEMIRLMYALQDEGIESDFLYEKDGFSGYWLEITSVSKGGK